MNLFDVLRMTWEEHEAQGAEDEELLEQLVAENRDLRDMLRIAHGNDTHEEIETALQ